MYIMCSNTLYPEPSLPEIYNFIQVKEDVGLSQIKDLQAFIENADQYQLQAGSLTRICSIYVIPEKRNLQA
jgi:hypothetical protein